MKWIRQRMTYANAMSTLAVFIALGGSSYAAVKINGASIKNRSIAAAKLKRNSLTGREIRESRLGRVPHAARADRVGGLSADELRLRCPSDTVLIADLCFEQTARPPAVYSSAVLECSDAGGHGSPGRRLPTHSELRAALSAVTLAPAGELTSNVYPSASSVGQLDVLVVSDQAGSVGVVPDAAPSGNRQYRCVTDPFNGPS